MDCYSTVSLQCELHCMLKTQIIFFRRPEWNYDYDHVRFDDKLFADYQNGFGLANSSYWMGLEQMHRITNDDQWTNGSQLLIVFGRCYGVADQHVIYPHFQVDKRVGYMVKR